MGGGGYEGPLLLQVLGTALPPAGAHGSEEWGKGEVGRWPEWAVGGRAGASKGVSPLIGLVV